MLAQYIVSQGVFENPLNRDPLSRGDCLQLDEHLRKYDGSNAVLGKNNESYTRVTDAFDLQNSIKVKKSSESEEANRRALLLRRQAAITLQSLFSFRRQRCSPQSHKHSSSLSSASLPHQEQEGGFFDESSSDWGANAGVIDMNSPQQPLEESLEEKYPELSTTATQIAMDKAKKQLEEKVEFQFSQLQSLSAEAQEEDRRRAMQAAMTLRAARKALLEEEARINAESARQLLERAHSAQQKRVEEYKARAKYEKEEQMLHSKEWYLAEQQAKAKAKEDAELQAKAAAAAALVVHVAEVVSGDEGAPEGLDEQAAAERKKAKKLRQRKNKQLRSQAERESKERQKQEEMKAKALEQARANAALKCTCCGMGVVGRGFERLDYRYCSTACLQKHRSLLESMPKKSS